MAEITASLVKELRERTQAGMMECKKALVEANGDIELAIDNMRKSGQAKAAKKAGRVAAEGVILARVGSDFGLLLEINCETDFVAKDQGFVEFANKVADDALANKLDIEALSAKFEDERANLVAKIGENITIRRVNYLDKTSSFYIHGSKIGVLVAGVGADADLFKQVAMHIAASRPEFVKPEDIAPEVVEKERQIQIEILMNSEDSDKSQEIKEKIIAGKLSKFTGGISLTGQTFIIDEKQTVGEYLKAKSADVTGFIRFELGEGIEKVKEDFASEVAKITGSNA